MNMTELKARIQSAVATGKTLDGMVFTAEDGQKAIAAISQSKHYGNTMTPKFRDSILTNRFGIWSKLIHSGNFKEPLKWGFVVPATFIGTGYARRLFVPTASISVIDYVY